MAATFACPIGWCDTFPYPTQADLNEHLARHPEQAATPVSRFAAVDDTPIRSFSPGGTRATASSASGRTSTPVATSAPVTDLASEKQVSYLQSLLAKHPDVSGPDMGTLSKRAASTLIDTLRNRPVVSPPVVAKTEVPEGLHMHNGQVFKVQRSKTGNLYAKQLDVEANSFEYVGARPLRDLSEDTLLTIEAAKAFGVETGVCCVCGRTLRKPESIAAGIGPICAGKF